MFEQSTLSTLRTIFNYIGSDITKKKRSFKIGVFTIFLVVTFIMLLKSIVDVAPIAFLKVGQDQAGVFDFQITSDYAEPYVDGDVNQYASDPFEYAVKTNTTSTNFVDYIISNAVSDQGDHAEVFGFNLLKFNAVKDKLDELNLGPDFKGFSPRWTLPTRLRNTGNPSLNTSCLLLVIDSAREVDLGLAPYFQQDILGDNEIMVAESALRHLSIDGHRKEKIEVFFDVAGLVQMFSGQLSSAGDDSEGFAQQLQDQLDKVVQQAFPSSEDLVGFLRKEYDLNITNNNILNVEVRQVLEAFGPDILDIQIPTFNLTRLFPDADFSDVYELNLPIIGNGTSTGNYSMKDFI
jgi:hypothetical protein